MLSRGMILNSGALLMGAYSDMKACKALARFRTIVVTLVMLSVLFGSSIYLVSELREEFRAQVPDHAVSWERFELDIKFDVEGLDKFGSELVIALGKVVSKMVTLIMDRWVGMEGALAVSSYPELGWDLWEEAWGEQYANYGTSLYDRKIAMSQYLIMDMSNRHFISLPGVLAFFFYPGSYGFLFFAMVALGILGAAVEVAVYKWGGGNLILCSLMGFVVAYRYVHFGYVPAQSYLLAGALVLNVGLIYLLGRMLAYKYGTEEQASHSE